MLLPHQSRAIWFRLWSVKLKHMHTCTCTHACVVLTIAGSWAVHSKVSGLVCLQPASLHSRTKHLDFAGVASFPDIYLQQNETIYFPLLRFTKDVFTCVKLLYNTVRHLSQAFILQLGVECHRAVYWSHCDLYINYFKKKYKRFSTQYN